jgi:serine/threonine protein kinase
MGTCSIDCLKASNQYNKIMSGGAVNSNISKLNLANLITKKEFKLIEIIGVGGYGYVHKAQKKDNRMFFALKTMSKLRVYEKNSIQSVLNERKLLTKINHPYVDI